MLERKNHFNIRAVSNSPCWTCPKRCRKKEHWRQLRNQRGTLKFPGKMMVSRGCPWWPSCRPWGPSWKSYGIDEIFRNVGNARKNNLWWDRLRTVQGKKNTNGSWVTSGERSNSMEIDGYVRVMTRRTWLIQHPANKKNAFKLLS